MAYFEMDASTLSRLDFMLLRDGGITAYHAEAVLAEDLQWFEEQGYDIRAFDGHAWCDESDFHDDIARALEFPSYHDRGYHDMGHDMGQVHFISLRSELDPGHGTRTGSGS